MFYRERIHALESSNVALSARLTVLEERRTSDYEEITTLMKRCLQLELKSALGYLNQSAPAKEETTAFGGHLPFTARKRDYETRNQKKPEKKK